jgi:coniferyl-aldehyde dehydrogenase
MNAPTNLSLEAHKAEMNHVLARQKAAHLRDGPPSAEKRIEWINRCIDLLVGHQTRDR